MNRITAISILAVVCLVAWGCTTSTSGGGDLNTNTNDNTNTNINDNTNSNTNDNENTNENSNDNENTNDNTDTNENGNENENENDNSSPEPMTLTSRSFNAGDTIDMKFVRNIGCGGQNFNPQLTWGNEPDETLTYVVVFHDPDGEDWIHWCVFDIPVSTRNIESSDSGSGIPGGMTNSTWGVFGYQGPCPPTGEIHSYVITVYALDVKNCGLTAGNTYTYSDIIDTITPYVLNDVSMSVSFGR